MATTGGEPSVERGSGIGAANAGEEKSSVNPTAASLFGRLLLGGGSDGHGEGKRASFRNDAHPPTAPLDVAPRYSARRRKRTKKRAGTEIGLLAARAVGPARHADERAIGVAAAAEAAFASSADGQGRGAIYVPEGGDEGRRRQRPR